LLLALICVAFATGLPAFKEPPVASSEGLSVDNYICDQSTPQSGTLRGELMR
jgi:hypothetical protein